MKLDLLSSATVTDGTVKFVARHRGLIQENEKVRWIATTMTLQNLMKILDKYNQQQVLHKYSQFGGLLEGLPFYDWTKPSLGKWITTFNNDI